MDLENFDTQAGSESGAFCHLRNPKSKEKLFEGKEACGFVVLGPDSEKYRSISHKRSNQALKALTEKANKRNADDDVLTAEKIEDQAIELCVACVLEVKGLTLNKKPVTNNPTELKEIFTKYAWLREQLSDFIGDRANFIQPLTQNS